MISETYRRLEETALNNYGEIIDSTQIIASHTGRARKLRINIIDGTFIDVWHSPDGEYSFHWEQNEIRSMIYRHDNAPHNKWSYVKTFPKHCHDGSQDNVTESHLPDEPKAALCAFLGIVRGRLIRNRAK